MFSVSVTGIAERIAFKTLKPDENLNCKIGTVNYKNYELVISYNDTVKFLGQKMN